MPILTLTVRGGNGMFYCWISNLSLESLANFYLFSISRLFAKISLDFLSLSISMVFDSNGL